MRKLIAHIYFAAIRSKGQDLATHFIHQRPLGMIIEERGREIQYIGKSQYRYLQRPSLLDRYLSRVATRGIS